MKKFLAFLVILFLLISQSFISFGVTSSFYKDVGKLKSSDTKTRRDASYSLKTSGDLKYHPYLIQALKDKNSMVRINIAYTLGNAKAKWAWDALLNAINDPSYEVRRNVLSSLAYMLTQESIKDGQDVYDPKKHKKTVEVFLKFLNDPESGIRKETVYYLSFLEGRKVTQALMEEVHDSNSLVRERAVLSFKYFLKDKEAVNNEIKELVKNAAKDALKDNDVYVRRAAIRVLAGIEDDEVIDLLINSVKDKDLMTRVEAVYSMKGIKNDRVREILQKKLNDKYYLIREAALDAFASDSSKDVMPFVKKALNDEDGLVRVKAVSILGQKGDEESVSLLLDVFENENLSDNLRYKAIYYLYLLKSEKAVSAFIRGLKEDNIDIRYYSAKALEAIKPKKAVPELVVLLKDNKYLYRNEIMDILGAIKDKRAVPALRSIISEEKEKKSIKLKAIETIGNIQDKDSLKYLQELAKSNDKDIQKAAKEAIKLLLLVEMED